MKTEYGKILNVNLLDMSWYTEEILPEAYRSYLGGYGLGAALLMERMNPGADPLGPENILGFGTGCLTGTGALIASRFMVFGKSPSTKGWGDSNCGGHFGKKMRNAGFDFLLFSGIADSPVYVIIDNGKTEILNGDDIWGFDTYETEETLKRLHGSDCQISCIGPAGEQLSTIAGICTDKGRYAARSGLGAVMGSKKLKAVVVKGNMTIPVADPEKMKTLRKKYLPVFKEEFPSLLTKYGTPIFFNEALHTGDAPVKNWSSSVEEIKFPDRLNEETFKSYEVRKYGCSGCPIVCGAKVKVKDGPYATPDELHQIEYETLGMFGPNLLINEAEALIRINDLCNRYGMDTISCGGLCAFAVECFETGIITTKETGGLRLTWSNPDEIIKLIEQMRNNEGLGGILAKGFEYAIENFGEESRRFAIAVRNEGLPAHDPRWGKDLALTYYSDATPARHTQGSNVFHAAGYEVPEEEAADRKIEAQCHIDNAALNHALSSAGLCLFGYSILDFKAVPEFLEAVLGGKWSAENLIDAGMQIHSIRDRFNLAAEVEFEKYKFPDRILGTPPLQTGENKGVTIELDSMVASYFEAYNLRRKTISKPEKLALIKS